MTTKSNDKKIQELDIKTVILIYNKADNLELSDLNQLLDKEQITIDMANTILKKIFFKLENFSQEAYQSISCLLNFGAKFENIEAENGYTALMHACFKSFIDLVNIIISNCPTEINKVNKQNRNCLFYAITSPFANKNLDLIHVLLKNNININQRENIIGDSSLSISVKSNLLQISALLLQYGANPNIKVGSNKESLLHIACSTLNMEMMSLLLINKADCSLLNEDEKTPLDILLSMQDNLKTEDEISICKHMIENMKRFNDFKSEYDINEEKEKSLIDQAAASLQNQLEPFDEVINSLSIRKIRNEFLDFGKTNNQKDILDKTLNNKDNNDISPIPLNMSKIKSRDIVYLPLAYSPDYKELCIDMNKDISITMDLNSTMVNEIELYKNENKVLTHQSHVQHNTIIDLHNNSLKLAEMVEILKAEINNLIDTKKSQDDKLNLIYRQIQDKDEKIMSLDMRLSDATKTNILLMEHKAKLEYEINEKVRNKIIYYIRIKKSLR